MDRTRKHKNKNKKYKTKKLLRGGSKALKALKGVPSGEEPHFKQRKAVFSTSKITGKSSIVPIATQKRKLLLPSGQEIKYYTNTNKKIYVKEKGVLIPAVNGIQRGIKFSTMTDEEILAEAMAIEKKIKKNTVQPAEPTYVNASVSQKNVNDPLYVPEKEFAKGAQKSKELQLAQAISNIASGKTPSTNPSINIAALIQGPRINRSSKRKVLGELEALEATKAAEALKEHYKQLEKAQMERKKAETEQKRTKMVEMVLSAFKRGTKPKSADNGGKSSSAANHWQKARNALMGKKLQHISTGSSSTDVSQDGTSISTTNMTNIGSSSLV